MQASDHPGDIAAQERHFLESIPDAEFVALRDESLVPDAIQWSGNSLNLLAPPARPYVQGRYSAHCVRVGTWSVLQHTYPVGDFWLVVLESSAYVLVKAQIDLAPGPRQLDDARRVASVVLREELRTLHVMSIKGIDEVVRFSTLPLSGFGFGPSEIQGGIVANRVYFIWQKAGNSMSRTSSPRNEPLPEALEQVWFRERAPHLAVPPTRPR